MSKKLNIQERIAQFLDAYKRLWHKAEKAEAEVKRLQFALEETQAALEGVIKDVDYGDYLKDYNAALTRAERAEDEVADLKHQLSLPQAVYADRIPCSLHLKSDVNEIEKLRMQLAACSIASFQNTEEGVKLRLTDSNSPYWSVAYSDICAAVDREIKLRAEVDRLRADVGHFRAYLVWFKKAYKLQGECLDSYLQWVLNG